MSNEMSKLSKSQRDFVAAVLLIVVLGLEATPMLSAVSPPSLNAIRGAICFKLGICFFLGALLARVWILGSIEKKRAFTPIVWFAVVLYGFQSYCILRMLYRASQLL